MQIGKSGASWITQAFLLACGSIAAAMPFTGFIFAGELYVSVGEGPHSVGAAEGVLVSVQQW
jgi:hypothetical protein